MPSIFRGIRDFFSNNNEEELQNQREHSAPLQERLDRMARAVAQDRLRQFRPLFTAEAPARDTHGECNQIIIAEDERGVCSSNGISVVICPNCSEDNIVDQDDISIECNQCGETIEVRNESPYMTNEDLVRASLHHMGHALATSATRS